MYSDIKAKTPYGTHQTYEWMDVTFTLERESQNHKTTTIEHELQRRFWTLRSVLDYESIRTAVANVGAGVNIDVAKTRVLQGSSLQVSNLSKGEHHFQCCIHPWMRMNVEVK